MQVKEPMYSPFAENAVSFSAILLFGSSPATFSANHTAFAFIPGAATTRYTAKTFGASGAKTRCSSCEDLSFVITAILKWGPAGVDCGLASSDPEIPEAQSVAVSTTRAILFMVPPSRFREVLPPIYFSRAERGTRSGVGILTEFGDEKGALVIEVFP